MAYPASYDFWDILADIVWRTALALACLWVLAVVGLQVLHWLSEGYWLSLPLSTAFEYFQVNLDIVRQPHAWHGLAKIGRWLLDLPLSIVPPVVLLLVIGGLKDAINKK